MVDLGAKLQIPTYMFFPLNATLLYLMLHLSKIVLEIGISFKDLIFLVKISLPLILATDLPTPIQDRLGHAFYWVGHHSSCLREAKGIHINTFHAQETKCIEAFVEGKVLSRNEMPSIYLVKPLTFGSDREVVEHNKRCDEWLKLLESNLFLESSSWLLEVECICRKIRLGLLLWIWKQVSNGFYGLCTTHDSYLFAFLPGFEVRTQDRGMFVPSWPLRIPILSHPSTGGFLSHYEWNSISESISFGVPVIAWLFYVE
eukprot:Gb_39656 [translate_table: standard]